jgi:hypothetical protein
MMHPSFHTRVLVVAVFALSVGSCDVDLFGTDSKRIAHGYFLSLTDGPDHCALKTERDFITPQLELIGWRKPLILCQTEEKRWLVVATDTGLQTTISDAERQKNPLYSSIELRPAIEAWQSLSRHKSVW